MYNNIQGIYNICTYMGSCLVGPWIKSLNNNKCLRLDSSLVSSTGSLFNENYNDNKKRHEIFQCPYHGWEYCISGRLVKAPYIKGIQHFIAKDYSVHSIPIQMIGPILFMHFSKTIRTSTTSSSSSSSLRRNSGTNEEEIEDNDNTNNVNSSNDNIISGKGIENSNNNGGSIFDQSKRMKFDQMRLNGFNHDDDLRNLRLVQTNVFRHYIAKRILVLMGGNVDGLHFIIAIPNESNHIIQIWLHIFFVLFCS